MRKASSPPTGSKTEDASADSLLVSRPSGSSCGREPDVQAIHLTSRQPRWKGPTGLKTLIYTHIYRFRYIYPRAKALLMQ